MKRSIAYYHLPDCLSFMNCIKCFCRYFGNIENIFMIGVILDLSMVPQRIVSGAEDEQDLGMMMQEKC